MVRAFVSVGSNIEPERHIPRALELLASHYPRLAQSSIYETPAVGFDGAPFHNLVVSFDTTAPPRAVVAKLHLIEDACQRDRQAPRFGPRTMDLDLILYGELVSREAGLELPRDEILREAFVLCPLAELAGELHHPLSHLSFATLWKEHPLSKEEIPRVSAVTIQPTEGRGSR